MAVQATLPHPWNRWGASLQKMLVAGAKQVCFAFHPAAAPEPEDCLHRLAPAGPEDVVQPATGHLSEQLGTVRSDPSPI